MKKIMAPMVLVAVLVWGCGGETGSTGGTREGDTVNLRFDEQGFLEGASASGTRSVASALFANVFRNAL